MGREKLLKLSKREHLLLEEVKFLVKQLGVSTFSKEAQNCVKNGCFGSFVGLGCQLIIEHYLSFFPSSTKELMESYEEKVKNHA